MRLTSAASLVVLASVAQAAPIQQGLTVTGSFARLEKAAADLGGMTAPIQQGLTVTDFFARLEKAAADLAEGGMTLNRVNCLADGTRCGGYYGSGNRVTARGPSKDAGMETITVEQMIPGETEDFWLTSALVMELLDGDFKTIPERSRLILDAMRAPGTSIVGNVGKYTFGRSPAPDNLSNMVVTAK
jgi:hypothetical protein